MGELDERLEAIRRREAFEAQRAAEERESQIAERTDQRRRNAEMLDDFLSRMRSAGNPGMVSVGVYDEYWRRQFWVAGQQRRKWRRVGSVRGWWTVIWFTGDPSDGATHGGPEMITESGEIRGQSGPGYPTGVGRDCRPWQEPNFLAKALIEVLREQGVES